MADLCGAKKRNGDPCRAKPIPGGTRCVRHGGKAPQVRAAAARRVALQTLDHEMTVLGIRDQYPDVDPAAALLRVVSSTHAEVLYLEQRVAELDDQDLAWGKVQHEKGVGPEGPIDKTTEKATEHVLVTQLRDARDRLARYSTMALRAGIEERRVRMAEDNAALIAGAIQRVLAALDLTETQQAQVPTVVPAVLRSIAS